MFLNPTIVMEKICYLREEWEPVDCAVAELVEVQEPCESGRVGARRLRSGTVGEWESGSP